MSAQHRHSLEALYRRQFLRASGAIAAMAHAGTGALSRIAFATVLTKAERDKLSPDEILALLKKGNERFYTGKRENHDFLAQQRATAEGQHPAAVLLSCIDSRAPAETIMDLRIGDIFNCRVAGNVENPDILGSMEFACKLSGAKVVLVMGHTACGAIKPAVAATTYSGERTSKNYAFVDAVARKNVELTIADIRRESPVLADLESKGAIKIAGAMYNLKTGRMDFFGA